VIMLCTKPMKAYDMNAILFQPRAMDKADVDEEKSVEEEERLTLSAEAFAALNQFYQEQDERDRRREELAQVYKARLLFA
jgi:TPR repeat protein